MTPMWSQPPSSRWPARATLDGGVLLSPAGAAERGGRYLVEVVHEGYATRQQADVAVAEG
jgi:hypothetical protein